VSSVDKLREKVSIPLPPGAFGENILVEGIVLYELPIGTRLAIGDTLCEVTQIGKECHQGCAIRNITGDCVMPREGIFARVLKGGVIKAGDTVTVL
jgi:MOSC domain-containing protein YiiM